MANDSANKDLLINKIRSLAKLRHKTLMWRHNNPWFVYDNPDDEGRMRPNITGTMWRRKLTWKESDFLELQYPLGPSPIVVEDECIGTKILFPTE
jgi:hypothetical protein